MNRFWKTYISRASYLINLVDFSSGGFVNHLCQYYQGRTIFKKVQFWGIINAIHYLLKRCIWTVRDTYSFVCWGAFRISRVESYLAGKVLLDLMQCIALLLNVHLDIDIQCLNFSTYNTWTFFWKKRKHLMSFLSRHWAWSNRENSRQPLKQLEQVQLESSCRESTRILERIKSTLIRSNSDQLSLWRGFYWQFGWQKEISPIWFPQIHSQIEIIDILVRLYKC